MKVYLVRTLTNKWSTSAGLLSPKRSMYLTLAQTRTLLEALESARRWRTSHVPPLRVWVEEKGKIAHAERRKKPRLASRHVPAGAARSAG